MKKGQFDIIGMTYSACAMNVEKTVSKLPAGTDVSVNKPQKQGGITMERKLIETSGYQLVEIL